MPSLHPARMRVAGRLTRTQVLCSLAEHGESLGACSAAHG